MTVTALSQVLSMHCLPSTYKISEHGYIAVIQRERVLFTVM